MQLRLLVQAVEDDLGHLAALQLDDHAHAGLVRLVAQVGNALDALLVNELADFLEQRTLVNLIGQFVDDDRLSVGAALDRLKVRLGAHHHAPAAGTVALVHTADAVNDPGGREIRCGNNLDQLIDAHLRVTHQRQTGIDNFVQVVRRDVRRHPDGDARRTVDQEVRNTRRQDQRFLLGAVVVRPEIDGFLVDVGQQIVPDARHAHFGVTHRSGVVAIDRAEVTLPIDQHVAQGKILRHPHDRVVDRDIAVRMVFTDHVTNDTRRFFIGFVPVVAQFVHRVQNPSMHRFQTIARVRQGPTDDHAHRVIEVGTAHLVFEADGQGFFGELFHGLFHCRSVSFQHVARDDSVISRHRDQAGYSNMPTGTTPQARSIDAASASKKESG